MNRIIILFTAVLFFGASTVSEAQEEWTLQKCIDYALENNIQIKQQELNTQYSRNQVNSLRARLSQNSINSLVIKLKQ